MSTTPRWLHAVTKTLSDNAPSILSGIAVAGVVGTAVLAVRATPKAIKAETAAKEQTARVYDITSNMSNGTEPPPEAFDAWTIKQTVMSTWRCYIPAAICGAATIACIVGANAIGIRQQAALLGAYTLVDGAFREYKDKVLETVGAQKARKVDDDIQKDRLERDPAVSTQVLITGLGEQLCYDSFTGRYFKSDIETIRKAQNELNALVLTDMYASQNAFYELLDLPSTVLGEELGWNIETRMELVFTSHLSEDGTPCLAIGYAKLPLYNYDKV